MLIFLSILATIIATSIGGVIGAIMGTEKALGKVLALAAGIMLGLVCFEIVPNAIRYTNVVLVIIFIFVGILLVEIVERSIDKIAKKNVRSLHRTGLVLLIVIGLHNFPEGLAIGASGVDNARIGLILGLVLSVHDISEGMAISVPLVASGTKKSKAIIYTFLSATTAIIGAIIGVILGNISTSFSSVSLAIAGGAMLYVVFVEILPQALRSEKDKIVANLVIIGIIIGMLLINLA